MRLQENIIMNVISLYIIPIVILLIIILFCICNICNTLSTYNTRLDMIEVNIMEIAVAINEIDYDIASDEQTSSS